MKNRFLTSLLFFFATSASLFAAQEVAEVTNENFFKKVTNNNVLTDEHIENIMEIFDSKKDIEYVAKSIDNNNIAENDYSLSVSSYVTPKDNRAKVNLVELKKEISITVEKIDVLRAEINSIIKEIEV